MVRSWGGIGACVHSTRVYREPATPRAGCWAQVSDGPVPGTCLSGRLGGHRRPLPPPPPPPPPRPPPPRPPRHHHQIIVIATITNKSSLPSSSPTLLHNYLPKGSHAVTSGLHILNRLFSQPHHSRFTDEDAEASRSLINIAQLVISKVWT